MDGAESCLDRRTRRPVAKHRRVDLDSQSDRPRRRVQPLARFSILEEYRRETCFIQLGLGRETGGLVDRGGLKKLPRLLLNVQHSLISLVDNDVLDDLVRQGVESVLNLGCGGTSSGGTSSGGSPTASPKKRLCSVPVEQLRTGASGTGCCSATAQSTSRCRRGRQQGGAGHAAAKP